LLFFVFVLTLPSETGSGKVDEVSPLCGRARIHEDYDCMLTQTNINQNNNKFYVIQVSSLLFGLMPLLFLAGD